MAENTADIVSSHMEAHCLYQELKTDPNANTILNQILLDLSKFSLGKSTPYLVNSQTAELRETLGVFFFFNESLHGFF